MIRLQCSLNDGKNDTHKTFMKKLVILETDIINIIGDVLVLIPGKPTEGNKKAKGLAYTKQY